MWLLIELKQSIKVRSIIFLYTWNEISLTSFTSALSHFKMYFLPLRHPPSLLYCWRSILVFKLCVTLSNKSYSVLGYHKPQHTVYTLTKWLPTHIPPPHNWALLPNGRCSLGTPVWHLQASCNPPHKPLSQKTVLLLRFLASLSLIKNFPKSD